MRSVPPLLPFLYLIQTIFHDVLKVVIIVVLCPPFLTQHPCLTCTHMSIPNCLSVTQKRGGGKLLHYLPTRQYLYLKRSDEVPRLSGLMCTSRDQCVQAVLADATWPCTCPTPALPSPLWPFSHRSLLPSPHFPAPFVLGFSFSQHSHPSLPWPLHFPAPTTTPARPSHLPNTVPKSTSLLSGNSRMSLSFGVCTSAAVGGCGLLAPTACTWWEV